MGAGKAEVAMANTLMTWEEVCRAFEPVMIELRKLVEDQLAEMKPGEERVFENPGGRDLIPLCIKKPK